MAIIEWKVGNTLILRFLATPHSNFSGYCCKSWEPMVVILGWWLIDHIVWIWCISWLVMCRCRMRCGGRHMSSERFMLMDQERWRVNTSRLVLRDPRNPDGVTGGPRRTGSRGRPKVRPPRPQLVRGIKFSAANVYIHTNIFAQYLFNYFYLSTCSC